MQTITAKLPDELYKRLGHLVEETERNKSYFIRQALEEFLEEKEDYLISIARMAKKGKRYSLEEIEKECDLED